MDRIQEQAVGRAHRIGQTKDVHVYSLVAEQTIDRRITEVRYPSRYPLFPESFLNSFDVSPCPSL